MARFFVGNRWEKPKNEIVQKEQRDIEHGFYSLSMDMLGAILRAYYSNRRVGKCAALIIGEKSQLSLLHPYK